MESVDTIQNLLHPTAGWQQLTPKMHITVFQFIQDFENIYVLFTMENFANIQFFQMVIYMPEKV